MKKQNILITLAMVLTMALPITGYSQEDASPTLEEKVETIAEFFVSENYDDVKDNVLNDVKDNVPNDVNSNSTAFFSTINHLIRDGDDKHKSDFRKRLLEQMWTLFQEHLGYEVIHWMDLEEQNLFYQEMEKKLNVKFEAEEKKIKDKIKAKGEAAGRAAEKERRRKTINANKALHELYEEAKSPSGFWEDLFGF